MTSITAREYYERQATAHLRPRETARIETAFGNLEIDGMDENYWVRCPKANGGFGQSFSLHATSEILIS